MLELDSRLQANDVDERHMNVLITGGKEGDRNVVQDVIFNALEGAGFRNLAYMPNSGGEMPSAEVKTLLDAIKEENPGFFNTHISIESAERAGYEVVDVPNEEAWDRITTHSSPDRKIKMEVGNNGITIRF
jgi:hypothetical protein